MPRPVHPGWGLLPAAILISLIPFFPGCSDVLEPAPATPEVLSAADAAQDFYAAPISPPQTFPALFGLGTPLGSDTLAVATQDGQTKRIFLYGIDAPEPRQAYNSEAQACLARLIAGATLKVVPVRNEHDPYPFYTVAKVYLPGGRNVSAELVAAGFAWYYPRYAPGDSLLAKLQEEAQKRKLGLWVDPEPISPWEFSRRIREKAFQADEKIYKGG